MKEPFYDIGDSLRSIDGSGFYAGSYSSMGQLYITLVSGNKVSVNMKFQPLEILCRRLILVEKYNEEIQVISDVNDIILSVWPNGEIKQFGWILHTEP